MDFSKLANFGRKVFNAIRDNVKEIGRAHV